MKTCSTKPRQTNDPIDLQARVVRSYVTLVDQMLKYLTLIVDAGMLDDELGIALTPEMVYYAETNMKADFRCFREADNFSGNRIEAEAQSASYRAQILATYGIILAQAIIKREPPYGLSDIEKAGRNQALGLARSSLQQAIIKLKERVREERIKNNQKGLEERLFFLTDDDQYLRRAQGKLDELESLLR